MPWYLSSPRNTPQGRLIQNFTIAIGVASLAIQASAQTAGTSPADSASVYRRTVDPTGYRAFSYVVLADEVTERWQRDGQGTRRFRRVVQILNATGAREWAERAFSYAADRQTLSVHWIRVIRPTGDVVHDGIAQSQETGVPASLFDPVYSQTKVVRYSLSGVAPGVLVDLSWTIIERRPYVPGDIMSIWRLGDDVPVRWARFVFEVPKSIETRIAEHRFSGSRQVADAGGQRRYVWTATNALPAKPELFAPDSSQVVPSVTIASSLTWNDIGRWYADLAKDQYTLGPRMRGVVDSVLRVKGAGEDTLHALHRWISRDLRYVSVAQGLGRYAPRRPDVTVMSGYGDCKDKSTLFIAATRYLGMQAYPVLLNASGSLDASMASAQQLDHVIVAIKRSDAASYLFVDPTWPNAPPGVAPFSYQGSAGFVVLSPAKTRKVTFPVNARRGLVESLSGVVTPTGLFSATVRSTLPTGTFASFLMQMLAERTDSARRAQIERGYAAAFPGAKLDTVVVTEDSLAKHIDQVEVHLHDSTSVERLGSMVLLHLPVGFGSSTSQLREGLRVLEQAGDREYPIDAGKVVSEESQIEWSIELPSGWVAELPKGVVADSEFGAYRSSYEQNGRILVIRRVLSRREGTVDATRIQALKEWLRAIGMDNPRAIRLH